MSTNTKTRLNQPCNSGGQDHHWLIDGLGVGRCKKCGAERDFGAIQKRYYADEMLRIVGSRDGRQSGLRRRNHR